MLGGSGLRSAPVVARRTSTGRAATPNPRGLSLWFSKWSGILPRQFVCAYEKGAMPKAPLHFLKSHEPLGSLLSVALSCIMGKSKIIVPDIHRKVNEQMLGL